MVDLIDFRYSNAEANKPAYEGIEFGVEFYYSSRTIKLKEVKFLI